MPFIAAMRTSHPKASRPGLVADPMPASTPQMMRDMIMARGRRSQAMLMNPMVSSISGLSCELISTHVSNAGGYHEIGNGEDEDDDDHAEKAVCYSAHFVFLGFFVRRVPEKTP